MIKSDFPLAVPLITSLRSLPLELESVTEIRPLSEIEVVMLPVTVPSLVIAE